MLPRHSAPDSVLWPVIVSRVPGRLIGLLKPGLLGPRKRVTVPLCFKPPRSRRIPLHSSARTLRKLWV